MTDKYAMTDNLYYTYNHGKDNFKHIFLPNPISGKNSATRIRNCNNVRFPYRKYQNKDRTMEYFYDAKDVI